MTNHFPGVAQIWIKWELKKEKEEEKKVESGDRNVSPSASVGNFTWFYTERRREGQSHYQPVTCKERLWGAKRGWLIKGIMLLNYGILSFRRWSTGNDGKILLRKSTRALGRWNINQIYPGVFNIQNNLTSKIASTCRHGWIQFRTRNGKVLSC